VEHCALNVVLYSPGAGRWTMTERGARHVSRRPHSFQVGPSALHWEGDALVIDIDEWAQPLPRRVRGRVVVHPESRCSEVVTLDAAGRHRWGPIAPSARVTVDLPQPGLRWSGPGYLDSNEGDEPVTEAFVAWDWMRARRADGSSVVVYDVLPRAPAGQAAPRRLLSRHFGLDGQARELAAPERQPLPSTGWRIDRQVRSEAPVKVLRTLEDTPFYARSIVSCELEGETLHAMHETLDVTRFGKPWVQALLPWRMPRRG
jgi:carotenoid 1,2-hydratase